MKVILTGGAGFIGSGLLWHLNKKGIEDILVVDHINEEKKKNLTNTKYSDYLEKEDFRKKLLNNEIDTNFDLIIHMGACSSTTVTDEDYVMDNNFQYSVDLAEWALKNNIPFIYASSAATYGEGENGFSDEDENSLKLKPINLYAKSKQAFDLWVLKNGLNNKVTGFKFFNVFGPNEYHKGEMKSVVCKVYDDVVKTGKIKLFKSDNPDYPDGGQLRDFVYVKDVIGVMDYFIENPSIKGIFNLGTGIANSWNDLAEALFEAENLPLNIEYIDMPEKLKGKYQYYTCADLSKLRGVGCNYEFMTLKESVKDYAEYLKDKSYLADTKGAVINEE